MLAAKLLCPKGFAATAGNTALRNIHARHKRKAAKRTAKTGFLETLCQLPGAAKRAFYNRGTASEAHERRQEEDPSEFSCRAPPLSPQPGADLRRPLACLDRRPAGGGHLRRAAPRAAWPRDR